MSIEAIPLITRSLEHLENRVEVLIAESRLAYGVTDDPDDIEEVQLMTVLVSFDPTTAQRWSARALAGTYIAAQCKFEQLPAGRELDDWLGGLLKGAATTSLYIVFSLPSGYSEDTAHQISVVLTTIRNGEPNNRHLAVAVCLKPSEWANCLSIDGFVISNDERAGQSALQMFSMFVSLMAPGLSAAIDADDLRGVLGTALLPARLATGVWVQSQTVFIPAMAIHKELIKNCRAVAFMPASPLQLSSQIELTKAIRQYTENDTNVVVVASYGMSTESVFVEQIVPVLLLITPTGGKSLYF